LIYIEWRISPISALFGNKIYVFGGKTKNPKRDFGPGLVENFNDLFVLNLGIILFIVNKLLDLNFVRAYDMGKNL